MTAPLELEDRSADIPRQPGEVLAALVGDLASRWPSTIRVFQQHGLDFCCGGKRSVAEAASRAGVAADLLAEDLLTVLARPERGTSWLRKVPDSPADLCKLIVGRYHVALRAELLDDGDLVRREQLGVDLVEVELGRQGRGGPRVVAGEHRDAAHTERTEPADDIRCFGTELVAHGDDPQQPTVVLDDDDGGALILEVVDGGFQRLRLDEPRLAQSGDPTVDQARDPVAGDGLHVRVAEERNEGRHRATSP